MVESAAEGAPRFEPEVEVRFAVVMYGGSSLAIYMNGVSQELLRMVRATAPSHGDGLPGQSALLADAQLEGTEVVYRKLGRMLPKTEGAAIPADGAPIRRRFVVDILSGSSAGGINGVFLAKALANQQKLDGLERLWVSEGDIGVLLNDRRSVKGLKGLSARKPPPSLLNGERMYRKLLQVCREMERTNPSTPAPASPYVRELDLYVTATDLAGLPVTFSLSNGIAYERRHRNVFHFAYATAEGSGDPINDLHTGNDPFLAFAARCTSSLPFVFEPFALGDVARAVAADPDVANPGPFEPGGAHWERWARFYAQYNALADDAPADEAPHRESQFARRSFGDGGSLDNSPFSHATGSLARRRADLPVERLLVYVEPDPSGPVTPKLERPDALQNLIQQVVSLPRYQTIKDDLDAVKSRNNVINRINQAIAAVEQAAQDLGRPRRAERPRVSWAEEGLETAVEEKGLAYVAYHRLKVDAVTHDLAETLARAARFQEGSDEVSAMRLVIACWREDTYAESVRQLADGTVAPRPTLNRFLMDFDLAYRLRRIVFVQRKSDLIAAVRPGDTTAIPAGAALDPIDGGDRPRFVEELRRLKRVLAEAQVRLRRTGRDLRRRGSPLEPLVRATGVGRGDLREILRPESGLERKRIAQEKVRSNLQAFEDLAQAVARELSPVFKETSDLWWQEVEPPAPDVSPGIAAARHYLAYTYACFDDYDMVSFPLQYGTGADESAPVTILRISPRDAHWITDNPADKVAGLKYGHFGAFFSRSWRENDILWGRLDAAECLIKCLAPESEARTALIIEAVNAIVQESIRPEDRTLLTDALARATKAANEAAEAARTTEGASAPASGDG